LRQCRAASFARPTAKVKHARSDQEMIMATSVFLLPFGAARKKAPPGAEE
jgi:hypothetical protein